MTSLNRVKCGDLLGTSYIVFIDECNSSKIFKMASNSFKVTDVPFYFLPFDCCNRGYVVLGLNNSSLQCGSGKRWEADCSNDCVHIIVNRGPMPWKKIRIRNGFLELS